jgi:DNA-binding transcriptional LysR family regulator
MSGPDLNLLVTLEALLNEGSVAGAARRLGLSPSAMSRALARLRLVTGDPLLVRAGRSLVPTPRALALRDEVGPLLEAVQAVLRPAEQLELGQLTRSFTIRAREGFVESFGAILIARCADEAPGVRLRFLNKLDKDTAPLRDGSVDLDTGVVSGSSGPELRTQALFRDRFIGVVRADHPLAAGPVTPEAYAAARHVLVARRRQAEGRVDAALAELGLQLDVAVTVSSFSEALVLVRESHLVATLPARHTASLRHELVSFELPVPVEPFTVSLLWHPRMDADPPHRWLRGVVREVCRG